jgi:hypothetical protein
VEEEDWQKTWIFSGFFPIAGRWLPTKQRPLTLLNHLNLEYEDKVTSSETCDFPSVFSDLLAPRLVVRKESSAKPAIHFDARNMPSARFERTLALSEKMIAKMP